MRNISANIFKRMKIHWKRKKLIIHITDDLRNSSDYGESDEK